MILREFLYVDTDKVRSMQAQLDGGIAEEERETTKNDKRTEAGVKGLASHYQNWGTEKYVHKSLGDALFPALEEGLEAKGFLRDVSEELRTPDYWTSGRLQSELPPGAVIRISAPGTIFDARYVAAIFSSFIATYSGLEGIGAVPGGSTSQGNKKPQRSAKPGTTPESRNELEDLIPDFPDIISDDGSRFGPTALRALVKISRGLFTPGLHLNLTPTNDDRLVVGARLQEGRQFLDGDPEMLFARYGIEPQEWTLVGTVGHHSKRGENKAPEGRDLTDDDNMLVRGRTSSFMNRFMQFLGSQGFADLAQYPGFSVVPLAVYRIIPPHSGTDLLHLS